MCRRRCPCQCTPHAIHDILWCHKFGRFEDLEDQGPLAKEAHDSLKRRTVLRELWCSERQGKRIKSSSKRLYRLVALQLVDHDHDVGHALRQRILNPIGNALEFHAIRRRLLRKVERHYRGGTSASWCRSDHADERAEREAGPPWCFPPGSSSQVKSTPSPPTLPPQLASGALVFLVFV